MRETGKAPQGRAERLNGQGWKVRAEQSQPQYNNPAELIQDCKKFEKEIKHYASLRVEPRVCVYGISSSVPFSRGWI